MSDPSLPSLPSSGPLQPAIRVMMMPKETNGVGTIFGGVIMSYIDLAGAVEAKRWARNRVVTVAMNEVRFHAPVFVGNLVSFYTETLRIGRTSVTVKVTVEVEREGDRRDRVTEAEVVFVQIDDRNQPMPIE